MPINLYIESNKGSIERAADRPPERQPFYSIKKRKTRLLVQKGLENLILKLEDIVLFYTENKIVYVIDRQEKKYIADSNLMILENELDEMVFFRANRQHLVNINFIKSFRAYEKVKIKIELTIADSGHCIIVSQENAPQFRKWINEV